ncbi:MAG: glycerophosphoryl diester phosphodiesterase membrane domain-containing protein, partial [Deltaproteobacteria bacterium]|nr:glycerophosphoryl diester phosphodiesterase membrane domain-containing protein [Deltaproteobacteria bacterium]
PPEFIAFIAVAAILLLVLVLIIAVLLVRWTPAVPLCLFEGKSIRATLQGSRELVKGYAGPIALLVLGWIGSIAIISVLTFAILDQLNSLVLAAPFDSLQTTSIAVALLIALSTGLSVVISFAGFTGYALLVVHFYQKLSELKGITPADLQMLTHMEKMVHGKSKVKQNRAKITAVVALLMVTATLTVYRMTDDIRQAESQMIEITAHRGSSEKAPENSLSAISQAKQEVVGYYL